MGLPKTLCATRDSWYPRSYMLSQLNLLIQHRTTQTKITTKSYKIVESYNALDSELLCVWGWGLGSKSDPEAAHSDKGKAPWSSSICILGSSACVPSVAKRLPTSKKFRDTCLHRGFCTSEPLRDLVSFGSRIASTPAWYREVFGQVAPKPYFRAISLFWSFFLFCIFPARPKPISGAIFSYFGPRIENPL